MLIRRNHYTPELELDKYWCHHGIINLEKGYAEGRGYGTNKNGVLIGAFTGGYSEGGNH